MWRPGICGFPCERGSREYPTDRDHQRQRPIRNAPSRGATSAPGYALRRRSPSRSSSCLSRFAHPDRRAAATTTLWPRRSTAFTRQRSSTGVDPGDPSKRWNTRPSNGSTGSTIAGCWSPLETSRLPKPKINIMPSQTTSIWQRNSQPNASGRPGAVQRGPFRNAN